MSIVGLQRDYLITSDKQWRGKRVSVGLLQHGKRVLEWLNDFRKGQG